MKLAIDIKNSYYNSIATMLRALLPGLTLAKAPVEFEHLLKIETKNDGSKGLVSGELFVEDKLLFSESNSFKLAEVSNLERKYKTEIKLLVYKLCNRFFGQDINPWGILTGVRPTKLVHQFLERGLNWSEIDNKLEQDYAISPNKRNLLAEVVKKEQRILSDLTAKEVGIYIGIPFCPSRCSYCSFAAYSLEKQKRFLPDFLNSLSYEIKEIAKEIDRLNLEVNTVYLGGGTPTVLAKKDLEKLLQEITDLFDLPQDFTVEAGRVDTLGLDKLKLLKEYGVKRICINPQTMNDQTLKNLGRTHSSQAVVSTYQQARKLGFNSINMDLIIGLPNETATDIKGTIKQVIALEPENITLHALAYKRSAKLENQQQLTEAKNYRRIFTEIRNTIAKNNYSPYYMYRQKNTVGNLENIGYTKAGQESLYNILMIAEQESIIALGGGGMTKLVDPKDFSIQRINNPRNPAQYIDQVKNKVKQKQVQLTSLFR